MSGLVQVVTEQVSTHCGSFGKFGFGMQVWAWPLTGGHCCWKHGSLTQKPASHFLPSGHGNSPAAHGNAHWQFVHVAPPGHTVPSSVFVSQSSSRQLQVSPETGPPWQTT
jgi:hypothetical protein